MRLVPCSPPAGLALGALVDAPVTCIVTALAIGHAAREREWQAFWDLSEESGSYYLRGSATSAWYRIDAECADDGAVPTDATHGDREHAAHGSVCIVGRWRRGEPAPVLYAPSTVQARRRAQSARRALASVAVAAAPDARPTTAIAKR